jgi:flagellin
MRIFEHFKEEILMRINHNIGAQNTHRQLMSNTANQSKSIEKLSSGLRINRAGDDAAGLAISEKMRGQIRGLDQASRNSQDTISLIQTAEGALNETHSILQRMRELAVQSSNDTNTDTDRSSLQNEINQLTSEVNRIANTTEFNTKKLLNGDLVGIKDAVNSKMSSDSYFGNSAVSISTSQNISTFSVTDVIKINIVATVSDGTTFSANVAGGVSITTTLGAIDPTKVIMSDTGKFWVSNGTNSFSFDIANETNVRTGDSITITVNKSQAASTDSSKQVRAQIGANAGQELGIGINDMDGAALGIAKTDGTALDITTQSTASGAVSLIDNALQNVSTERSKLGAFQNRLEHTINNLGTSAENLTAAESRIRDVDMAKEMMEQTKNSILAQAAQAMLAQANQQPQGVLQLLR